MVKLPQFSCLACNQRHDVLFGLTVNFRPANGGKTKYAIIGSSPKKAKAKKKNRNILSGLNNQVISDCFLVIIEDILFCNRFIYKSYSFLSLKTRLLEIHCHCVLETLETCDLDPAVDLKSMLSSGHPRSPIYPILKGSFGPKISIK